MENVLESSSMLAQTMILFTVHDFEELNTQECFRTKERPISEKGRHWDQLFSGSKPQIVNNTPQNIFSEAVNQFSSWSI